jgi:hypothetical protein
VYVQVSLSDTTTTLALREQDDFSAFKVVVDDEVDWDGLSVALEGAGRVDPPFAWIEPAALRSLGRFDDPSWTKGLDAMVTFAANHDWVDQRGAVRAHCEWTPGGPRL